MQQKLRLPKKTGYSEKSAEKRKLSLDFRGQTVYNSDDWETTGEMGEDP